MAVAALEETHPQSPITEAYVSGIATWPTDRNLLMGYGNLLYRKGDVLAAESQYQQVISEYEDYAPAWNNLAEIYFESGDKEKAAIFVERAIALGGPFIEYYRATLAKISAAGQSI